ncbi:hypothetical protein D6C84_08486 [Aureobasidium pullulans]|uniref:Uncharacterized protein n=1 Tax=Aureobasidium pullulans TaxID=5580 RepID=A0A4S9XI11_AURPU|nr:hypothetical protein D6C84_08486 [Aureobasidium pullulans]
MFCDMTVIEDPGYLAKCLVMPLITLFHNAKSSRSANFHDQFTPESFQAGLNAREMAHIYHDSERDTKYYVLHGTLPQKLIIPAWDHLAIGEP